MRATLFLVIAALAIGAPAAATAATLQPGIVYSARPGEVNRLKVSQVFVPRPPAMVSVSEYSAPLKLGAGCVFGTPVVCNDSGGALVHLGDMNDVAWVASLSLSASVFGGAGDDDVFADAESTTVDGGSGNDVIRVGGNGIVRADGGPGTIRSRGPSANRSSTAGPAMTSSWGQPGVSARCAVRRATTGWWPGKIGRVG